jgi:integrase
LNKQTANEYHTRLTNFEKFVVSHYNIELDNFIQQIKDNNNKFDVYDILSDYSIYLDEELNLHTTTLKQRIVTAKNFLETQDIDISERKFKLKIRLPKDVKREKQALDKNDIVAILNGISEIRLKTYVMLLASTGLRAAEGLSIRNMDLDLESNPAKIILKGEFTKTKTDRYVFITKELKDQLIKWLDFKYRKRRICYKENGKSKEEYRTPETNPNDLVFSVRKPYKNNNKLKGTYLPRTKPQNNYCNMLISFNKTLDRIGMGKREYGNEKRREITFHSFRSFVKSCISDLGHSDYSEWFIGHSGSTYWRKKGKEKVDIYAKIEPYLTFLDIQQLERKGADMETRIEELEETVQVYRTREQQREEKDRKHREWLTKMEKRFNELTAKLDMERDEKTGHIKRIKNNRKSIKPQQQ